MSIIKKFEEFDFSQTLPVASKDALTSYYSCDESQIIRLNQANFRDPDSLLDIAISRPALRFGAFRLSNLTYLFIKDFVALQQTSANKNS